MRHAKRAVTIIAALGVSAVLAGCEETYTNHGFMPQLADLETIEAGKDTRGSVLRKLGRPSSISSFDSASWFYAASRVEHYAFYAPKVVDRTVVTVSFSESGLVENVGRYGIEDGQIIDLGDRRLEVLLTPGHAADALCLWDPDEGLLLVGDTFYRGRVLIEDWPAYAASARRLVALAPEVDRLLPAHSSTLLQTRWLERLGRAVTAIEAGDEGHPFAVPWATEPWREHRFDGFSLLRRPPEP